MALSLLVMWTYSGRPFRLKSRPGLDLLTHALFVESYPYMVTLLLLGVTLDPARLRPGDHSLAGLVIGPIGAAGG